MPLRLWHVTRACSSYDHVDVHGPLSADEWCRNTSHKQGFWGHGTTTALCPDKRSSIGNKYICVLGSAVTVASITLHAVGAAGTQPRIAQFAAFSCGGVAAEIDAAWAASRH